MLNEIVVVFPLPTEKRQIGQKTFAAKTEEEFLKVTNTDQGCLIIICDAKLGGYKPITLAVFNEWIYWERKA